MLPSILCLPDEVAAAQLLGKEAGNGNWILWGAMRCHTEIVCSNEPGSKIAGPPPSSRPSVLIFARLAKRLTASGSRFGLCVLQL